MLVEPAHQFELRAHLGQHRDELLELGSVQVGNREEVMKHLTEQDIACGIHYPVALPVTPAYAHLGYAAEQFPVACTSMDRILSLPMHADLTDADVDLVIEAVREVAK